METPRSSIWRCQTINISLIRFLCIGVTRIFVQITTSAIYVMCTFREALGNHLCAHNLHRADTYVNISDTMQKTVWFLHRRDSFISFFRPFTRHEIYLIYHDYWLETMAEEVTFENEMSIVFYMITTQASHHLIQNITILHKFPYCSGSGALKCFIFHLFCMLLLSSRRIRHLFIVRIEKKIKIKLSLYMILSHLSTQSISTFEFVPTLQNKTTPETKQQR